MAATTESTTPFRCRDALERIFKGTRRSSKELHEHCKDFYDIPVLALLRFDFQSILYMCLHSGRRLAILERQAQGRCRMVFDFRYYRNDKHSTQYHVTDEIVYWVIDKHTKALVLETGDVDLVPKTGQATKKMKTHQVLSMFKDGCEPQTTREMKEFLMANPHVHIFYEICSHPLTEWLMFRGEFPFKPENEKIVAFAKSDLSLGYRIMAPPKKTKYDGPPEWMKKVEHEEPVLPTLNQANRRSAVSVKLKGLTLAHSLNVISLSEMQDLSKALTRTCGAMWMSFDEEKHVRHIVYVDEKTKMFKIELKCNNNTFNDTQWTLLFDFLERAGEKMAEKKQHILAPVLEKLRAFMGGKPNSWETCYKQLSMITKKHKIFTFCDDDSTLHALKCPLAGWGASKGGREYGRGVMLHTLANYTLTGISNSKFVFTNLSNYFNYKVSVLIPDKDDVVLHELAHDWLSHPLSYTSIHIRHSIITLKYQAPIGTMGMVGLLNKRGTENANIILDLWTALAQHYVTDFQVDISSLYQFSLSQVAFTIVWNRLRQKGGHLYHSIEQMHQHTEYMLRPFCKGGFSYSCKDQVVQGHPLCLEDEGMEIASSLQEYDLTSSYGFSGKSSSSACGFGVIFTPDSGRVGQRHVSFEYMATMYTIWKWTMKDGPQLVSVYSNFSPLGIFYIGKYPIDLVGIFDDGTVEMVQFDGHYIHGDYNNPGCKKSPTYVNQQTRQEVEAKTIARDEAIVRWMKQISHTKIKYSIYTDCCHPEYNRACLKRHFKDIPELKKLIVGFDRLDGSLECFDPQEFTFLAIVEGHCNKINPHYPIGPIFNMDKDNSKTPTLSEGKMLLTADYYAYLKSKFDFQVDTIEWIVYYKKCHILPQVFDEMLHMRQKYAHVKSKAGIVKSAINYACGYFGLNSDKPLKTTAKVSHRAPRRYNVYIHDVEPLQGIFSGWELLIVKTTGKPKTSKFMCSQPFVLFVSIVEYGKLRLNQALQCLQKYLRPTAFRLLYSNVDNMIFALSTDTLEEALQCEQLQPEFKLEWEGTWCSTGEPGQLKLEWKILSDADWKFVTPMKMFYSALALNQGETSSFSKTCAYKGLGSERSFALGLNMLKKEPIQVEQVRRVDKLANTLVKSVMYCS